MKYRISYNPDMSDLEIKIDQHLRRRPAAPNFPQSTLSYTNRAIRLASAQAAAVLTDRYPHLGPEVAAKLGQRYIPDIPAGTDPALFEDEGAVFLRTPDGRSFQANKILTAVHAVNPKTVSPEIGLSLYPPTGKRDPITKYPGFEIRFRRILEVGELDLDHPVVQTTALGFVTQVAKNLATQHSRELLKNTRYFAGFEDPLKAERYIDGLRDSIQSVRVHQAHVVEGLNTLRSMTAAAGYDSDQVLHILDMAFLSNKAFDRSDEFTHALEPMIRLISRGEWEQAYQHTGFLLRFFARSFPAWRVAENEEKTGEKSFDSLRKLAVAVAKNEVVLQPEEIPPGMTPIFEGKFKTKVEKVQTERETKIIKDSVTLSRRVLEGIAGAGDPKEGMRRYLNILFKDQAAAVVALLMHPKADESYKYAQYRQIFAELYPRIEGSRVDTLFYDLLEDLRPVISPKPESVLVFTPSPVAVVDVRHVNKGQLYRFTNDKSLDIFARGKPPVSMANKRGPLGKLLYDVLRVNMGSDNAHPLIDPILLTDALTTAYEEERQAKPRATDYSLGEYLNIVITDAGVEIPDTDPVRDFISRL